MVVNLSQADALIVMVQDGDIMEGCVLGVVAMGNVPSVLGQEDIMKSNTNDSPMSSIMAVH